LARTRPSSLRVRRSRGRGRYAQESDRQPVFRRTLDEDRLERVSELIQRLNAEAAGGAALVVEGRRDLEALRALGVRGAILCAKSSSSRLLDFVEGIDTRLKVIVLTDFDAAGERLARFLRETLERQGVKVDLAYRERLSALMRGEVKDIQGLGEHLERAATGEHG